MTDIAELRRVPFAVPGTEPETWVCSAHGHVVLRDGGMVIPWPDRAFDDGSPDYVVWDWQSRV